MSESYKLKVNKVMSGFGQQWPLEAAVMKDTVFLACPQIRFISAQKVHSDKKIKLWIPNMLKCSSTYSVEAIPFDCSRA